jgi:hypothetical protein
MKANQADVAVVLHFTLDYDSGAEEGIEISEASRRVSFIERLPDGCPRLTQCLFGGIGDA